MKKIIFPKFQIVFQFLINEIWENNRTGNVRNSRGGPRGLEWVYFFREDSPPSDCLSGYATAFLFLINFSEKSKNILTNL